MTGNISGCSRLNDSLSVPNKGKCDLGVPKENLSRVDWTNVFRSNDVNASWSNLYDILSVSIARSQKPVLVAVN